MYIMYYVLCIMYIMYHIIYLYLKENISEN